MERRGRTAVSPALAAAALMVAATAVPAQTPSVADLGWIAGCWGADDRETGSGEYWVLTDKGELLGVGRTVRDGKTLDYEFMQIHRIGDQLAFTAEPSCQEETTFTLVRHEASSVTFENPLHDFPQRIIYERAGPDRLVARVEGLREGALRSLDFPMTRQACEVLAAVPGDVPEE